ncbi:MAG: glycoside hydrolase family 108 protein [Janthinobacterium lividum]
MATGSKNDPNDVTQAMDADFVGCSAFTRVEEGGYVDDPRDTGNWTGGAVGSGVLVGSNMGVGAPVLAAWMKTSSLTVDTMRRLSFPVYSAIAKAQYWNPMACDDMPHGIDLMLFDFGWNRGVGTSIRLLQRVLGVGQDGVCGPNTIRAAHRHAAAELVRELAAGQTASYRSLHNFNIYGDGWLARTGRRQIQAAKRCIDVAPGH